MAGRWFWYPRQDDFHWCAAYRTGDCCPFFQFADKDTERINSEHPLQKTDELFAAWMEKTVTSGSAKALWQNVEHDQIEKIFPGDGPGPVLAGFGMEIPEGDHAVFALQDILFPDNAPVQISAKINDCLIAVADVFAVNNPLFRTIFGHPQVIVNNGLQDLCPEDLCQGLVAEEIPARFRAP